MCPSLLQLIVHLHIQCGRNQARVQKPPLEKRTGLLQSPFHQKKLTWVSQPSAAFSLGCITSSAQPEWTLNFLTNQNFSLQTWLKVNDREEREKHRFLLSLKAWKYIDVWNSQPLFPCHMVYLLCLVGGSRDYTEHSTVLWIPPLFLYFVTFVYIRQWSQKTLPSLYTAMTFRRAGHQL